MDWWHGGLFLRPQPAEYLAFTLARVTSRVTSFDSHQSLVVDSNLPPVNIASQLQVAADFPNSTTSHLQVGREIVVDCDNWIISLLPRSAYFFR